MDLAPELIQRATDATIPELKAGNSALQPAYPVRYLDPIVVKVRTDHVVVNRPVDIAIAIDLDGAKHVLGPWLGKGDEGARFWLGLLTELKNRGITDVMIACCHGLTGFADAIEESHTLFQTYVVHLVRQLDQIRLLERPQDHHQSTAPHLPGGHPRCRRHRPRQFRS